MAQAKQLRALDDPKQLEQIVAQLEQRKSAAPDEMKPAFELLERSARTRLDELQKAAGNDKEKKP